MKMERYNDGGGDGGVGGGCSASPMAGKHWLDGAREGKEATLQELFADEPSLLYFRGVGGASSDSPYS